MSQAYKAAEKRLQDEPASPFHRRQYKMALLDPEKAEFDEGHGAMKAVRETKGNEPIAELKLKIQIIRDPTRPLSNSQLLQFFIENTNRDVLIRRRRSVGIIYEVKGSQEIPLFKLNGDEVWELAHGNGYNASILSAAVPAG